MRTNGAAKIKVIEIVPRQIVTKTAIEKPKVVDGQIRSDVERDILKLVVIERHRAMGNVGVGLVRGFNLKRGALGWTVAHDAHNLVVVGTNDDDVIAAVEALEKMRGRQVAVSDAKVKAALSVTHRRIGLQSTAGDCHRQNCSGEFGRQETWLPFTGALYESILSQYLADSGIEVDRSGTRGCGES